MGLLLSYLPPSVAPVGAAWAGNHLQQPIWRRPTLSSQGSRPSEAHSSQRYVVSPALTLWEVTREKHPRLPSRSREKMLTDQGQAIRSPGWYWSSPQSGRRDLPGETGPATSICRVHSRRRVALSFLRPEDGLQGRKAPAQAWESPVPAHALHAASFPR